MTKPTDFQGFLPAAIQFETSRLVVQHWKTPNLADRLAIEVVSILTPEVVKDLPSSWQRVNSPDQALAWLKERDDESILCTIRLKPGQQTVGFLLLNLDPPDGSQMVMRLGYLLSSKVWGNGLGSELIAGLVEWCARSSWVSRLVGGVEVRNRPSLRVLEKNGFVRIDPGENSGETVFLERTFA
jgi:RimJ/RimL family protein N-acetyltransferase